MCSCWPKNFKIQGLIIDGRGGARIFRWGAPRPLKGYHVPPLPAGGEGSGTQPTDDSEVSFLKRFKVLENELIFQKYQHLSWPKNRFYDEFRKTEYILHVFLNIFRKIILNLQLSYKSREILCEFEYLIEKFMKKANKK